MHYPKFVLRLPLFSKDESASGPRDALSIASMAVALLFLAVVLWQGVPAVIDSYSTPRATAGDFRYLLGAGELAISDEAKRLYGPVPPNPPAWVQEHGYGFPDYYPYAPGAAYATSVLTVTSADTGLDIWRACVFLASAALGVIVALSFRSWAWRLAVFAAIVCWEPLLLNARIGQTGAFIAAATAVGVVVFLRHRLAGALVLSLLALKPTAAIGPGLMVFPQKVRVWVSFLAASFVVIMLPFLYLGIDAFRNWIDVLDTRSSADLSGAQRYNQGLTSILGRTEFVGVLLVIFLVLTVLVVDKVHNRLGLCGGAAFAIFTGILLNPHSLLYDWGSAFIGVMLVRKAGLVPERYADLAIGLLAISLFAFGQGAWSLRAHDYVLRPLTGWTITVTLALLLLAWLRPTQQDVGTETPGPAAPALA